MLMKGLLFLALNLSSGDLITPSTSGNLVGHWQREIEVVKEERLFYSNGTAQEILTIGGVLALDITTETTIDESYTPARIHSELKTINYLDPTLGIKIPEGEESHCIFAIVDNDLHWECGRGDYPLTFTGGEAVYQRTPPRYETY